MVRTDEVLNTILDQTNREPTGIPLTEEETSIICRWLETQLHILRPNTSHTATAGGEHTRRRTTGTDIVPVLSVGDQVRITNSVSLPFTFGIRSTTRTGTVLPNDNTGVIVKITKSRVHIRLDISGAIVQRSPRNVTQVDPSPQPN